jgi:hypothetical protein
MPVQLSAPARRGKALPGLNAGRLVTWGRGRPAPTEPNKNQTKFRKIVVDAGRVGGTVWVILPSRASQPCVRHGHHSSLHFPASSLHVRTVPACAAARK